MWVDSINVFCKAASGLVLSKFKNGPRPIQPHRKTMINQEKIHTMYIPMSSLCLYHNKNDHNKNDDHHHNNDDDNNNNQHRILSQSLLCLFFNPFVTPLLAFSERMGIAVWLSSQVALERAHRFVLFIYIYIYCKRQRAKRACACLLALRLVILGLKNHLLVLSPAKHYGLSS